MILLVGALVGCRSHAASVDAGSDAPKVASEPADSGSVQVSPAIFCLRKDADRHDEYPDGSGPRTLLNIADDCGDSQPLLAQAARAAATMTGRDRTLTLVRAARKHPAYDWSCDVSDSEATRSWEDAKRPPDCNVKTRIAYFCAWDAGTGMFLDTLVAVTTPYPHDAHPPEEHIAYPGDILYQFARYEGWQLKRCHTMF